MLKSIKHWVADMSLLAFRRHKKTREFRVHTNKEINSHALNPDFNSKDKFAIAVLCKQKKTREQTPLASTLIFELTRLAVGLGLSKP